MHLTLCDYLAEILQNAIESGAGTVRLTCEESKHRLKVEVADNGAGMSPDQLRRCRDPFYSGGGKHPGRSQGLGLPLLAQLLESTGGRLTLDSLPGRGTTVGMGFVLTHIDTPPLGDLAECLAQAMAFPGDYDLVVTRSLRPEPGGPTRTYRLSRRALQEALGDLESWASLAALRRYLGQQEAGLREHAGGPET